MNYLEKVIIYWRKEPVKEVPSGLSTLFVVKCNDMFGREITFILESYLGVPHSTWLSYRSSSGF